MENKVLKPKIRFKGFTDTWEQRKLGEIANIIMGQSPDGINYTDNPTDNILIQGNADLDNGIVVPRIWTTQITKISKPNDIIFTVRAPVGEVAKNTYTAVIGRGVASISGNDFLYQTLKKMKEFDYWSKLSAGSTFDSINSEQLKNSEINIPLNEEQKQIGNFLEKIDNLITLHQSKYDKLVNVKKALLEKMFPKDGKNVPEIRFKGFTDTWEQRKLGKIANIIGGGTPSTLVSKYWNGDINWYSPVEIGDKIFVSSSQKKITQLGYEKSSAKLLPIGTVLFTSRAGIGNTAILAKEGCTNQGFQSIVPNKKEIDSYFIYSMTNQLKEYGEKIGAGSTFAEVSGKQMEEMPINIPKLEEQCKISQLFEKIDNLITLHQHKLEKLKNMKKSLLNKMFI